VVGNCGFSAAPFPGSEYVSSPIDHRLHQWQKMADYFSSLKTLSPPVHMISLVAHGNIRAAVMGFRNSPPSRQEMAAMESLVIESMQGGAVGLSTGLAYPPGSFSDTEEIIALAKIAARYGGIYVTHMRNEAEFLEESVDEAVEIARRAEIPLHISHLKAIGKSNHYKVHNILSKLENLVKTGMDISFDMYPYPATCTSLTVILPDWVIAGGREALVRRLGDRETRRRLRAEMGIIDDKTGLRLYNGCTWDKIMISTVGKGDNRWMTSKTIEEIAHQQGKDPLDAALDLVGDDAGPVNAVYFSLDDDNVWEVLAHPLSMVGSDGIVSSGQPHPRAFGSFPRFIRKGVNERKQISLETAIEKITSKVANRFSLNNKGQIKKGMDADITIFDLKKLKDLSTFDDPIRPPQGIKWVIVHGAIKKIEV
jgi:N-acyl-D-aspartate/D-glutamate deacylase